MKKNLILLSILIVAFMFTFTGCGEKEDVGNDGEAVVATEETSTENADDTQMEDSKEEITIKVGAPKAPPILPVLRMMESKAMGENVDIQIEFWETPEQLIGMIQNGSNDMYAFPLTVIAKLYNKGMGVKLTNVNTWGVSYLMSSDEGVKTWTDLKGKQLYIALQTSPPDIMSQYFLKEAGLSKEDVEIIYASKTELAQMMVAGKVENAVTIEPLVTMVSMKNPNMKVVLSLQDEWQKTETHANSMIPTAGIGTTDKYAQENHDLIVKFEEEYKKALEWVAENPEKAGELAEAKIGMKKQMIMKALPNMGMHYKNAVESKAELDDFYKLLFDFNPKTVGGKIPDENMYFK